MFFSILTEKNCRMQLKFIEVSWTNILLTLARYHKENNRKGSKCSTLEIIYKIFSTIIRYHKRIIL